MAVIEDDIIAGNLYDKYGTSNPIAAYLMEGFKESFESVVSQRLFLRSTEVKEG